MDDRVRQAGGDPVALRGDREQVCKALLGVISGEAYCTFQVNPYGNYRFKAILTVIVKFNLAHN